MLIIRDIFKQYGHKKVLDGINLSLEKGNVYGVVGKNGAGKTTLFRCIAGLERCRGEIESDYDNLKNHIGFLETTPIFLSRVTGWEYLKLLCVSRNIKEEDFEVQNLFDLPLGEYAEHYSTGMKKKLALLGILLQGNDIFILDEPFNGVDIQSNMLIVELIQRLKLHNKIVIISSHIFSTLSQNCDRIFYLDEGRLSRDITKDQYAELEAEMKARDVKEKVDQIKIK